MSPRPHKYKLAKDLINAVEEAKSDPARLAALINEIGYRKKSARKLAPTLRKAKRFLAEHQKRSGSAAQPGQARGCSSEPSSPSSSQTRKKKNAARTRARRSVAPEPTGSSSSNRQAVLPEPVIEKGRNRTCILQPWWLARLMNRKNTVIRVELDSVEVEHRNKATGVSLANFGGYTVRQKLLWKEVTIQLADRPDVAIVLSGIGGATRREIERELTLCLFQGQMEQARAELEALLDSQGYLNRKKVLRWKEQYSSVFHSITKIPKAVIEGQEDIKEWVGLVTEWPERVERRNSRYVEAQSQEWAEFFKELESNPMTEKQVESVLRDEDYSLTVAGAGTGKTSTVIGKVGYLIKSGEATSGEVLALAYGRKAAEEMRERVAARTGHDIEIRTFHALGLQIVADVTQEKPVIAEVASDEKAMHALIARFIVEMIKEPEMGQKVASFFAFHRYPAQYLEEFDSQGDYLQYLRKHEPRTLKGEKVKSFEELLIADWLTLHGVNYLYEHPYEHETATRQRRQYKPDFYMPDSGVYLEHFGINRVGDTAPGIDKKKYNDSIKWKRDLHEKYGTRMLETYSWERMEGVILSSLEQKLLKAGIPVNFMDPDHIADLVCQGDVCTKLVALLSEFLTVYKEGQWTIEEIGFGANSKEQSVSERASLFLEVFSTLHDRYESYLSARQELDFSDLISIATEYIKAGHFKHPYKRIIVDEYQDISRGRHRLLKEIIKQAEDCRIMCVGDDWQSIYGFTGSDIRMTTEFEDVFGFFSRTDLDRTFRFTQPILDVSTRFIQENPIQFRKTIVARAPSVSPSIEVIPSEGGAPEDLNELLREVDSIRPPRKRWRVMILGRYNFLEPEGLHGLNGQFTMLDVEFLSIHKSKGLEADVVIVLGLSEGMYGFPGQIPNDPLMRLVLPCEEAFPFAEERRVLYVAITRAKEKVYLISDKHNPSIFLEELSRYPEIDVRGSPSNLGQYTCPSCKTGKLNLVFPNRVNGYAWRCNLYPYCDGQAKMCSDCRSPIIGAGKRSRCMKPGCSLGNSGGHRSR